MCEKEIKIENKEFGFSAYNNMYVVISDSKEHCFVAMLKFLQKNRFKIWGLKKTARGNSHDELWEGHFTFIEEENPFKDLIDKLYNQKSSTYESKPVVKIISELTEEEMNKWSLPCENYNGEEDTRTLYITWSDNTNEKFEVILQKTFAQTIDKSRSFDYKNVNLLNNKGTIMTAYLEKYI